MLGSFVWSCLTQKLWTCWKVAQKGLEESIKTWVWKRLTLEGRTLRHLAHLQYSQGNDVKALDYRLFNAAPSVETAHALYTELLVEKWLFTIPNSTFSSQLLPFEKKCELLFKRAECMEEYEKGAHCSFFTMKASFHLRSDLIMDKLPPKEYWPSLMISERQRNVSKVLNRK